MTRPRPAARSWVVRGLLILAFLAGTGLWQGVHCPEQIAAAAGSAGSIPGAESDECRPARIVGVSTVAGARLPVPSGVRTFAVAPPPPAARTRPVPAVALATIGVCRT